ncbi:MAG TPA: alpha/beta hydrolase [Thermoanaerobaculia bacterium]|nr:alpha/beta hydrolase [Thermoanaerobaculia bacterium]
MIEKETTFYAADETLSGRFIIPDHLHSSKIQDGLLFLHGAGGATKERAQPIAAKLADSYGIPSFAFDFSGHGASTGTLQASSLRKRVRETQGALEVSGFGKTAPLCAFSMGGHIALELLKESQPRALILFYPAVYAMAAVDIPFGNPTFSATIRVARSWETSDAFESLRAFKGNLLIVTGERDEVIPQELISLLMETSTQAKKKRLVVVAGAPHLLLPTLIERQHLLEEVCGLIADYFEG